jgi:hypothetical protein
VSGARGHAETAAGLYGATLLARGRGSGLAWMADTPDGAWRSFRAALICLPAFLALRLLGWSGTDGPEGGLLLPLAAELAAYVTAWFGFALLSRVVVLRLGRGGAWYRYLAAWNWTNVAQYLVLLGTIALPAALGIDGLLGQGMALGGFGYAVWLEWFTTREALRVGGGAAAGLVLLDLLLGLFVGGLAERLQG